MIERIIGELESAKNSFYEVASSYASRNGAKPCIYEYYVYKDIMNGVGTCTSVALIKHVYKFGSPKLILVLTDISSSIGGDMKLDKIDLTTTTIVLPLTRDFKPEVLLSNNVAVKDQYGELELSYNVSTGKRYGVHVIPLVLKAYYDMYLQYIMNDMMARSIRVYAGKKIDFTAYAGGRVEESGVAITFTPRRLNYARVGILLKEIDEFIGKCINKVVEYPGAIEVFGRVTNTLLR